MSRYEDILVLKDKVSESLKRITKKFVETQQTMEKTKNKIQKTEASFAKLGKAIKAVAGAYAVKQIISYGNSIVEMGDRIDKMSQKIGMSRESFQEWDYIMSQNGGNIETLQMGFKTLTSQIEQSQKASTKLGKVTKKTNTEYVTYIKNNKEYRKAIKTTTNVVSGGKNSTTDAFAKLGIQLKNNDGTLRNQETIFNDTIRALQKMGNTTERDIIGAKLFGRSYAEMKPILNQTAEATDELRQKAHDLGLIISKEDIDNAVRLKDTMDTTSRVLNAKLGTQLMRIMPYITKSLEWTIGTGLPSIITFCGKVAKAFEQIGASIGMFVGVVLSLPMTISMIIDKVIFNIEMFIINLVKKITQLRDLILGIGTNLTNTAKNVVKGTMQNIKNVTTNNNQTYNNSTNNYYNMTNPTGYLNMGRIPALP